MPGLSSGMARPHKFAEGMTTPHYRRPLGGGSPWALAIWLGVYCPRTNRMGPDARIVGGRLWLVTDEALGQRVASPLESHSQTPDHPHPIAIRGLT